MGTLNRGAAAAMVDVGVEAATDVTGFGLVGHLLEMLEGSLSAELVFDSIPLLLEAIELAGTGVLPGGSKRNLDAMGDRVDTKGLDDARRAVLFDAQTSGGLLIAVDPARTDALHEALQSTVLRGPRRSDVSSRVTGPSSWTTGDTFVTHLAAARRRDGRPLDARPAQRRMRAARRHRRAS